MLGDHFHVDTPGYADFISLVIVAQARKWPWVEEVGASSKVPCIAGRLPHCFSVLYINDDVQQSGAPFLMMTVLVTLDTVFMVGRKQTVLRTAGRWRMHQAAFKLFVNAHYHIKVSYWRYNLST